MQRSAIYTSERMATRALAAEIRHDGSDLTALLEKCFGVERGGLGLLTDVQCEAAEQIDVLLDYQCDGSVRRVGLEAKFDHQITTDQLQREAREVDFLALLVVDAADAGEHSGSVSGVITWEQVLACFGDSRLSLEDVESMPLTKLKVERLLRQEGRPSDLFPDDWDVAIQRGGSGMPSIRVESPLLPDGRQIRGQIQVTGRGMPPSLEETYFEYHIGIQVNDDDADLPLADQVDKEPGWVPHLRTLEQVLVAAQEGEDLRLSMRRASPGRRMRGQNKLPLVEKFLDGKSWLAKGYTDGWALGVKSTKTSVAELGALCNVAASVFLAWYRAETKAHDARPGSR